MASNAKDILLSPALKKKLRENMHSEKLPDWELSLLLALALREAKGSASLLRGAGLAAVLMQLKPHLQNALSKS